MTCLKLGIQCLVRVFDAIQSFCRLKNLKMFVVRSSSVPKKVEHVVVQPLGAGPEQDNCDVEAGDCV